MGVLISVSPGIKVTEGTTYKASFYYRFPSRASFSGPITVQLQTSSGKVLGSARVPVSASKTNWNQVTFDVRATASGPTTDNQFAVTVDAKALSGQTIHFALFTLFPPTFRNRANGMRKDLAEALYELKPSFFRFPGGNNLEGQTVDRRWQWNATVRTSVSAWNMQLTSWLIGWTFEGEAWTLW
jgi:alpha-L-arabinofuranosidase